MCLKSFEETNITNFLSFFFFYSLPYNGLQIGVVKDFKKLIEKGYVEKLKC